MPLPSPRQPRPRHPAGNGRNRDAAAAHPLPLPGGRGEPPRAPALRRGAACPVSSSLAGAVSEVPPRPLPKLTGPGRHGQKCSGPQVSVASWGRCGGQGGRGLHPAISAGYECLSRHWLMGNASGLRAGRHPLPRGPSAAVPRLGRARPVPASLVGPALLSLCQPKPAAYFCPTTSRTNTCYSF